MNEFENIFCISNAESNNRENELGIIIEKDMSLWLNFRN